MAHRASITFTSARTPGREHAPVAQPVERSRIGGEPANDELEGQPRAAGAVADPVRQEVRGHRRVADDAAVGAAVAEALHGHRVRHHVEQPVVGTPPVVEQREEQEASTAVGEHGVVRDLPRVASGARGRWRRSSSIGSGLVVERDRQGGTTARTRSEFSWSADGSPEPIGRIGQDRGLHRGVGEPAHPLVEGEVVRAPGTSRDGGTGSCATGDPSACRSTGWPPAGRMSAPSRSRRCTVSNHARQLSGSRSCSMARKVIGTGNSRPRRPSQSTSRSMSPGASPAISPPTPAGTTCRTPASTSHMRAEQGHDLVLGRERARHRFTVHVAVSRGAPRREPERTGPQRLAHDRGHGREVVGGRGLLGPIAHHVGAHRGVGKLRADVDGTRHRLERVEVLVERLPLPLDPLGQRRAGDVLDAFHQLDQPLVAIGEPPARTRRRSCRGSRWSPRASTTA